jgi:HSP20 family protein
MTLVDKSDGNNVHRFEPVQMLEALQREMERFWRGWSPLASTTIFPFVPRLDVFEKEGKLIVKTELPGLRKEEVEVELDDGDLVIKGERQSEKEVQDSAFYRTERIYGRFYRRVPLGFEVTPEQITATLTDGVLEVTLPIPSEATHAATAHKIPVT